MTDNNDIFVISPIGKKGSDIFKKFDAIFTTMIEPACKAVDKDFNVLRADKIAKPGSFVKDILINLKNSYIVIANLTDLNPNVFYELGVRHSLSNGTIIITEDMSKIPSDLKEYRAIEYTPDITGIEDFKENLIKTIKEILKNPNQPDNPVQDRLPDVIRTREKELINEIDKIKKSTQQRKTSKLHLLSDSLESTETRLDRILKVIGFEDGPSGYQIWEWEPEETEDGKGKKEYIYKPDGNFEYYFPEDNNMEGYYVLVMSIHNSEFDINIDLADLRVILKVYSKIDYVDIKFIIAADIDLTEYQDKCHSFFNTAKKLAKLKKPDSFTFELWDKIKIKELEIDHGLRIE